MSIINDHFYVDYCPYEQVVLILKTLNHEDFLTQVEISDKTGVNFRSEVRKRLVLLNLAYEKNVNGSLVYSLTNLGKKIKEITYFDQELLPDLIHYLHMLYDPGNLASPKMFWSYVQCSLHLWNSGELANYKVISSFVQNRMKEDFPNLDYTASVGARFDHYAVGRWFSYVKRLIPTPVDENNKLRKRNISRYELILLAINNYYKKHMLRFGDSVILGGNVLDDISSIFFLDPECSKQLINTAVRLSPYLEKRDTYGGMAITLMEPYTIERI